MGQRRSQIEKERARTQAIKPKLLWSINNAAHFPKQIHAEITGVTGLLGCESLSVRGSSEIGRR